VGALRAPSPLQKGEGNIPGQGRAEAPGELSGVGAVARMQGLRRKAGKVLIPARTAMKGGTSYRNAKSQRSWRESGLAHEVVVAMRAVKEAAGAKGLWVTASPEPEGLGDCRQAIHTHGKKGPSTRGRRPWLQTRAGSGVCKGKA